MVGVICFWDRLATPYLAKYEKLLQDNGVDYEVVLWNRTPKEDAPRITANGNEIFVNLPCTGSLSKRVLKFLTWRSVVKKVIRRQKYDALIMLSTVPTVLLGGILLRHFRDRYLFDIRDYTFERHKPLRKLVMRLVEGSAMTAISSKGYLRWLEPSDKIIVNHNITVGQAVDYCAPDLGSRENLRFSFVGNVRLDTQTEALLLQLGRRTDFEQHFYGRILPTCDIQKIGEEQGIQNLFLHGPFAVEEKIRFFRDIDLLNAVYANARTESEIPLGDSTPLPNRLYDCLVFYRPLVASRGTYLAELIDEYGLGCTVNGFSPDAPQIILDYAQHFDPETFMRGCDKLRKQVCQEEDRYIATVGELLRQWR